MNCQVFISHGEEQCELAIALGKALERHGLCVKIDRRLLRDQAGLHPDTQSAIEASQAFLAIIDNRNDSHWLAQELQFALQVFQRRGSSFRIVPLLLGDAELGPLRWMLPESAGPIAIESENEADIPKAASRILACMLER